MSAIDIDSAIAALDRALVEKLKISSMASNIGPNIDNDIEYEAAVDDPFDWPDAPVAESTTLDQNLEANTAQTTPLRKPTKLYSGVVTEKKLLGDYPVTFSLPNKALVAETAYPLQETTFLDQDIRISRWRSDQFNIPDASDFPNNPSLNVVNSFFDYNSVTGASAWYPNFAHQCLFTAWNSYLLAQDELQVLEFPCLAALHSFLPRHGSLTVDHEGPSPILIQGAVRRCSIDTNSAPSIYGNAFQRASQDLVLKRLTVLDPPITSNIYAMEAPSSGRGEYSRKQIMSILSTAFTAFSQIVIMEFGGKNFDDLTERANPSPSQSPPPVELHIGYWGCGAYGGNSVLMILIQLLAAKLAGIEYVIIHGSPDVTHAHKAVDLFENELPLGTTDEAVAWMALKRFKWGFSDGN